MRINPIIMFGLMLSVLTVANISAHAQQTRISGKVTDKITREPIPFANIYLKGTTIGATSSEDGSYQLVATEDADSIYASVMGYTTLARPVKRGVSQVIDFALAGAEKKLKEVVILPDEDIADILMRWVIRNKDRHDPARIEYYQCEVYSKVRVDLNNIGGKFRERKALEPFSFVFDYADTSALNGKTYIPAFLSETFSDIYYRRSPRTTREFIRANRVSGIENESITQYLGGVMEPVNIYDNFITLFEKNFLSPVASSALLTYHYAIEDTIEETEPFIYVVRFEPRRKQEPTFSGTLWIEDSSFAVREVDMRVAGDANFNFINDYAIRQEYEWTNHEHWIMTSDQRVADMNLVENTDKLAGIFLHRSVSYRNFIFDRPREESFYSTPVKVTVDGKARERDRAYWAAARHDSLTVQEEAITLMVDSIKNVPVFRTYADIVYMITTGYLPMKKFEWGPLYKSLSFNAIEGVRLRAGGRTANSFSRKLMLEGHVAFGFLDSKFKYGAGMTYMLSKDPRRSVGLNFLYDLEQLGQSQNAFSEDNFFAAFFRRSPADKLNMVREFSGFYEHEWFQGFSSTVRFLHRELFAIGDDGFIINEGDDQLLMHSITSSEIQLHSRLAFRERYLYGEFERYSLGTKYPVIEVLYGYGIPDFLGADFEYSRLQLQCKHWFNLFHLGWSKYVLETGKIWGRLPYPLLKIHEGNETILFYEGAGNLLNYYEFISDLYVSLYYTHHFDGLFFNHIPLLRKLKWREVIHGRGVWGTMTRENQEFSEFPVISGPLDKPYFEAGVGIENIFRFGRIDAIWRLSHLDALDSDPFRIFISFQFSF